jgi:hypothetical protein
MRILVIALLSIGLFAFTSTETYDLKLNLKEGDKYKIIVTSDQNIGISMNGQKMEMKQSFKMYMPSLVKEVSKKQTTVGQLVSRVIFTQDSEILGSNHCDTDNNDITEGSIGSAMFTAFSGVINKPIIMNLESNGKVKSVDVTSFPKEMQKELRSSFKNSQGYYHLPNNPVAIGDKWESTYTLELKGTEYEFLNKYTLDSVSTERAFISLDSQPVLHKGNKMEGSQSGNLEFDLHKGIVLKAFILQDLTLNNAVAGIDQMKIESKIYIKGKFE